MMKKGVFKIGRPVTVVLTVILIAALFIAYVPLLTSGFAAFSESLSVDFKDGCLMSMPSELADGEVYAWKSIDDSLEDDKFEVTLAALGQELPKQPVSVVFVLDVSDSMAKDKKIHNAVASINNAVSNIIGANSENKVGLVVFYSGSSTVNSLASDAFHLEVVILDKYGNKIDNINEGYYAVVNENWDGAYVYGGTNIQAGLTRAYNVIKTDQNPCAKPIIILLTDGVPNYYNSDYTSIPLSPGSTYIRDGDGDPLKVDGTISTGMNAAAYTIMQATHLTLINPELDIYTIGAFDNNYLANATINPIEYYIDMCTGGGTPLYELLGYGSATEAAEFYNSYYPTGSYYCPSFNPELLDPALADIFQNYENRVLIPGSMVTITDKIGYGFKKPEKLTMRLKSGTYNFIYDGTKYVEESGIGLPGVSLTISDDNVLTWQFPDYELTLNTYRSGNILNYAEEPTKLTFVLELDPDIAEADIYYYTNYDELLDDGIPGATAQFYPDPSNTYYNPRDVYFRAASYSPQEIFMDETGIIMLKADTPPETDPPETDPPETDPPVTDPPVTDPPVTDPPVTDPPVTDPPVTDPPVTDPPVTDPPVTEPPETEPPEETPSPTPIIPTIITSPTPTPTPTSTPTTTPAPTPTPTSTPILTSTPEQPSESPDTGILGDADKPDEETGVAGEYEKLPQTGGVSASTILGLIGIALTVVGTILYSFKKDRATGK